MDENSKKNIRTGSYLLERGFSKYLIRELCMEFNFDYNSTILFIEEHLSKTQGILKRCLTDKEVIELIDNSIKFLLLSSNKSKKKENPSQKSTLDVLGLIEKTKEKTNLF